MLPYLFLAANKLHCLTLLHSEQSKLQRVLALLSAVGLILHSYRFDSHLEGKMILLEGKMILLEGKMIFLEGKMIRLSYNISNVMKVLFPADP